jgi:hypothetical protein
MASFQQRLNYITHERQIMFYTPEQYYEHHYSDGSRKSSAMGGGEVIYTGCISDVFTRPTIRKANMSYSTDPVSDADRHTDAQDAFTERLDAEIASVTEDIQKAFSEQCMDLHLPVCKGEAPTCAEDEALGLLSYPKLEGKLKQVLMHSTCRLVKQLREQMAEKYADLWVEDIAKTRI